MAKATRVLPHHFAAYDGKLVSMAYVGDRASDEVARFHLAAMRIVDNGFDGFVITPEGSVFEIKQGKRTARILPAGQPINLGQVVEMVRSSRNAGARWALSTQNHRTWGVP